MAAYSLMWLIFVLYAWSISSRQGRLKKDLDDLRARLGKNNAEQ